MSLHPSKSSDTLIILLLDGPYISQYADMAYHMAKSALGKKYKVKIFLYMDGVNVPIKNHNPQIFPNISLLFEELIKKGCEVKACIRCAASRGHGDESCYVEGVEIASVYDLAQWMTTTDKIITLGG